MGRPRQFDRDVALQAAMNAFWDHGYAATSTDDLRSRMGIGRQSLYATFGDKHRLYVEALVAYDGVRSAVLVAALEGPDSALSAIEQLLFGVASQAAVERARGCLLVSAAAERASIDPEVVRVAEASSAFGEKQLERALRRAQVAGELSRELDAKSAARFLFSTLNGLRIAAQRGASPDQLREVAGFALRALA